MKRNILKLLKNEFLTLFNFIYGENNDWYSSEPTPGATTEARKPQAEKSPEEVINAAPLQTIQVEQTNPVEAVKPWRAGTSMSEDELMVVTEKGSYNIPMELVLRLDYLVGTRNHVV